MNDQLKSNAIFPANVEELPNICRVVCNAARQSGMEDDNLWKLETSVDEACTNIACYGYADREDGKIWLNWELRGDKFIVTIKDEGAPFDQTKPTDPDFTSDICHRKAGGLGRYIMSRFLDGMDYFRENGKNTLVLIKKLTGKNESSASVESL